jgi:hypothetical protein
MVIEGYSRVQLLVLVFNVHAQMSSPMATRFLMIYDEVNQGYYH